MNILDELELNKKLITLIHLNLGLFEESVKIAKEIVERSII